MGVDDLWQANLVDMTSLACYNDGKKYRLTIINAFSKMAWCIVLENKSSSTIIRAFASVFGGSRRCTFLQTDKGTEFLNLSFQKLLADNSIKFYGSENQEIKASVVDRFDGTLKTCIYRFLPSLLHFAMWICCRISSTCIIIPVTVP